MLVVCPVFIHALWHRICHGAGARRKFAYFVALLARLLYHIEWDDFALSVQVHTPTHSLWCGPFACVLACVRA